MDRSELMKTCTKVLGHHGITKDMEVVALALQRYLVGEGRKQETDRRSYQRLYMRDYRAGKLRRKRGKRKRR